MIDIEQLVGAAVELFWNHPELDEQELILKLTDEGIQPTDAWKLNQFVPIAFVHVAFRDHDIFFHPTYELWNPDTDERSRRALKDEPFYIAATEIAVQLAETFGNPKDLWRVYGRSAEFSVIQKLRSDGAASVRLTEPILVTAPNA